MAIRSYKFMADFETTTNPEDVRVWASCLVDIETSQTVFIGNNIASMIDFLKNKNSVVYFHNLRFDGEFLQSFLLSNGYEYSEIKRDKTFSCLISDEGVFYSITVIFEVKNKKYKKAVFYDSLKKLPFKVSQISKAFELEDSKGSIDYEAERSVDHVLSEEEKDYIIKDCRIVAQALKIQFSQGLTRMTNASDAMHNYRKIVGGARFDKWFPVFPVELDTDIRRAYKGGFTYLNPKYENKRVKEGMTFDVNSLYPWAMRHSLLPYGYPIYFEGKPKYDENYPLFITHFKCQFRLKEGHIPCIQLKNTGRFSSTEYLKTSEYWMGSGKNKYKIDEPVELHLTSVDYQLFIDHYDIIGEPNYINGYKFKGAYGMFDEYIDYWMHIKATSTGAIRQLAKLMLNSLYGRFGLSPQAFKKVPYLDEKGIVRYESINFDTSERILEKYGLKPMEYRDPVYIPVACFITAYARDKTIRTCQSVYDRFIYCDTDSCHIEGYDIPENMEVHPSRLGAWKHEGSFVDSLFIRAKTYMETMKIVKKDSLKNYASLLNQTNEISREKDGIHTPFTETKVTCAGMPDNIKEKVTYDNFKRGVEFEGKLTPKRFKGGIVLMKQKFTIK